MLIKASKDDLTKVIAIYNEVLDNAENTFYSTWKRGAYPGDYVAEEGFANGSLFLYIENGEVVGSVILDSNQPSDYVKVKWQYDYRADEVLVIHTLCISPRFSGHGAGGRLLADIVEYARANGYKSLRFDTHYKNLPAIQMYKTNGFTEVGMTEIFVYNKARLLRCFEKKL